MRHKLKIRFMQNAKLSFEQLPEAISNLLEKVETINRNVGFLMSSKTIQKDSTSKSEEFIGIDEACEIVHLAKPTIYKLAQKGQIPHYKPSKELLFRKSELISWVERSHQKGSPSTEEIAVFMSAGNRRKPKNGWED